MNSNHFGVSALYLTSLTPGERRVVNNLARGLCVAMNIIPEERQLIAILGLGSESSNGQAMETWILHQLCVHQLSLDPDIFGELVDRLDRFAINLSLSVRCV